MGPLDEATDVKDECESPLELDDEPIEPTRGETVPEEYVWCGRGRGSDGNLSVMYSWRCGEDWAWYDTSGGPRGCTWAIDGRSSFSVFYGTSKVSMKNFQSEPS